MISSSTAVGSCAAARASLLARSFCPSTTAARTLSLPGHPALPSIHQQLQLRLSSSSSTGMAAATASNSNKSSRKATATSIEPRATSSRNRATNPSSFPRREPLPPSQIFAQQQQQQRRAQSTQSSGKEKGSSSSAADSPASPLSKQKADSMARRLTRFYTANFERRPVITLCVTNCILSTFGDACAQLIPMLTEASGSAGAASASIAWDVDRSLRFAMFGFSLGPLIEKWNRFLEYRFPLRPLTQVFEPSIDGSTTSADAALAEKIKQAAEKEGFRVNIDRGDTQQGQQFKSSSSNGKKGAGPHIVDPQTVAMPNTGQPGQISVAALFKRVAADQLLMAPIGLAIFISTMAILEGLDWDQVVERYKRLYWPVLLINWQIWPFVQIINFRYLPLRYRVPFSASLGVLWTIFLSFRNAKATSS